MKLWCYADSHHWADGLLVQGQARGWDVRLFDSMKQPDDGYLFMHLHPHPALRPIGKSMAQQFATNARIKMVPSYRECALFDDKLEQLRQFAEWLPPTRLLRTPTMAREFLDTQPALPIISKSSEGGGVRTLRTYEDCRREIKNAFSDLGVKNKYGTRYHSYLYWQEFVADPEYVMRVALVGTNAIMLHRGKRINMDRKISPVLEATEETQSAEAYARKFFAHHNLRFGAIDLIKNNAGEWKLIKYTTSWSLNTFFGSKFTDGRDGSETLEVLLDYIASIK